MICKKLGHLLRNSEVNSSVQMGANIFRGYFMANQKNRNVFIKNATAAGAFNKGIDPEIVLNSWMIRDAYQKTEVRINDILPISQEADEQPEGNDVYASYGESASDMRKGNRWMAREEMVDERALKMIQARDNKKYGSPDGPTTTWLKKEYHTDITPKTLGKHKNPSSFWRAASQSVSGLHLFSASQRTNKAINRKFSVPEPTTSSNDAPSRPGLK